MYDFARHSADAFVSAGADNGLTKDVWNSLNVDGVVNDADEVYRLVYFGGCEHNIRKEVWPYLLGHYSFGTSPEQRAELDETNRRYYETTMSEWLAVEAIVRQRDKEKTANAVAKLSSEGSEHQLKMKQMAADAADGEIENDVFEENGFSDLSDPEDYDEEEAAAKQKSTSTSMCTAAKANAKPSRLNKSSTDSGNVPDSGEDDNKEPEEVKLDDIGTEACSAAIEHPVRLPTPEHELSFDNAVENLSTKSTPSSSSYETVANDFVDLAEQIEELKTEAAVVDDTLSISSPTAQRHSVIVTDASIDIVNILQNDGVSAAKTNETVASAELAPLHEEIVGQTSLDALQEPKSACVSPASSNGGIYSVSEIDLYPNAKSEKKKWLKFVCRSECRANCWKPSDWICIELRRMCSDAIVITGILQTRI